MSVPEKDSASSSSRRTCSSQYPSPPTSVPVVFHGALTSTHRSSTTISHRPQVEVGGAGTRRAIWKHGPPVLQDKLRDIVWMYVLRHMLREFRHDREVAEQERVSHDRLWRTPSATKVAL